MNKSEEINNSKITGCIFNIERFATRDGPGIRTTVFLKGCPLSCLWCSNPESMKPYPQLFFFENLCQRCGQCVPVCPNKATSADPNDGTISIDRNLCNGCGKCVETCQAKAREISGKIMTIDEVMDEVRKDSLFYQNSGGGVTVSGGEPTLQPEFVCELLKQCQRAAFHTCLDTCGVVQPEVLDRILEHTSLVLFDNKHMNPEKHKEYTGVDNDLALNNLRMIVGKGKLVIIRVPLIPNHNDSEENIRNLATLMNELGLTRIDLLPYHSMGKTKYDRLGIKYKLGDLKPYEGNQVEEIKAMLESYGLKVGIG